MARISAFIVISTKLEKAVSFKNINLPSNKESDYKPVFLWVLLKGF